MSEIIGELSVNDLAETMNSFIADDIADAILMLPEAKIEKIRNLIKDEE